MSLVTLDDTKQHLNIPTGGDFIDAELQGFIDACTPVIEDVVGPVLQQTYTEAYDGGTPYIVLRHRPIVSITSVVESYGNVAYTLAQVASPALATAWSYTFETWGRLVRRRIGGVGMFAPGPGTVAVVYVAGYAATIADVPANVRLGALELIRHNWQMTQQGGRPAFGGSALDDEIFTPSGFAIPKRVLEFLGPNKRPPSIA